MISFFMPMLPPTTTFQDKKINWKTKSIYESSEAKAARQKLEAHLAKHKPDKPLADEVGLRVMWVFPGDHKELKWKKTKPDLDNLNKAFMDTMAKLGFFKDDAQVCYLSVSKCSGLVSGVFVEMGTPDELMGPL